MHRLAADKERVAALEARKERRQTGRIANLVTHLLPVPACLPFVLLARQAGIAVAY